MRVSYLLALLPLAACAPTTEQFAANCQSYGFAPGTVEMARCVQSEQMAYRQNMQAALASMSAQYQAQQALQVQQQMLQQQRFRAMQPQRVWVNRGSGW